MKIDGWVHQPWLYRGTYPGIPGAAGCLGSAAGGACSGGGAARGFHGSGMAGHGLGGLGSPGSKAKGDGQPVSASETSTSARCVFILFRAAPDA